MMVLISALIYKLRKLNNDYEKSKSEIKGLSSKLDTTTKRLEALEQSVKNNERAIQDFYDLSAEPKKPYGISCGCSGRKRD